MEGYHKLNRAKQLERLADQSAVSKQQLAQLTVDEIHQNQIENYLTDYHLPEGIAVNLKVNDVEYMVPMVTEEPSVIAAASNGAGIVAKAGGFQAESQKIMRGQVLLRSEDLDRTFNNVLSQKEDLLKIANDAHPSMQARGGGAIELKVRYLSSTRGSIDILVDTKEAMGANVINTMMEAVKDKLVSQGETIDMAVLSNLAEEALTTVTCRIPVAQIGLELAKKIQHASEFAQLDSYRAATHNKGIMNGIDAVVIATGNDWRAIESGAHAFAAKTGQYRGLSSWTVEDEDLVGEMLIPLPVGIVGGSIGINEMAQLNLQLLNVQSSKELSNIIGSVGLAQNLAALKALASNGIQAGHMRLQARSLLMRVGVQAADLDEAVEKLLKTQHIDEEHALLIASKFLERG